MSRRTPPTSSTRSTSAARTAAPAALPALAVEVPDWPVVGRAHRRIDTVRSVVGRGATLAGAAASVVGLFTSELTGLSLAADAALTVGGLVTLRLWKPDGHKKATATVLYVLPGAGLAGVLVGEQMMPGVHPGEAAALLTWAAATWWTRPARLARHLLAPPPSLPVVHEEPGPQLDPHPAAHWWAAQVATEGGAAPGTLLRQVERVGESALRAVICSATPGQAVPDISLRALSALMDVPEDQITITPVPGRGASVRQLVVGTPEVEETDPATLWAQRIAPKAMPGAVLTGVRVGRPGQPTGQHQAVSGEGASA